MGRYMSRLVEAEEAMIDDKDLVEAMKKALEVMKLQRDINIRLAERISFLEGRVRKLEIKGRPS